MRFCGSGGTAVSENVTVNGGTVSITGGNAGGNNDCEGTGKGSFDGNGHTVTMNINANPAYAGMFGNLQGTVEHLNVSGTVTSEYTDAITVGSSTLSVTLLNENVIGKEVTYNKDTTNGSDFVVGKGIVGKNGTNETICDLVFTGSGNLTIYDRYAGIEANSAKFDAATECSAIMDDGTENAAKTFYIHVAVRCEYTKTVKLTEGTFGMKLGGKDTGQPADGSRKAALSRAAAGTSGGASVLRQF